MIKAFPVTSPDLAFLFLVTLAALWYLRYLYAAFRQGRLPGLQPRPYVVSLATGWVLLAVGLLCPLAFRSESFAPHVTAHTILALAAPPFFLMAIPRALAWDLVPTQRSKRWVRSLTNPYLAGVGFESFIMLTHMPGMYDALTMHVVAHALLHLSLFLLGILYWWPVVEPLPVWGTYGWLWKVVYLFLSRVPLFALGIALALTSSLVYEPAVFSWRVTPSPVLEQQVAGAVFIAITNVVLLVAITAVVLPRLAQMSQE